MPCKSNRTHSPFIHADRKKTRCLGHIEKKRDTPLAADRPHLLHGLNGSQNIGGVGKNDETGVRLDRLSHGHGIDESFRVERNEVKIDDALFTEMMKRPEDGIMLKA